MTEAERKELEADGFHVIGETVYASISKFSEITGRDRRTVTDRLRELASRDGPGRAKLYPTAVALPTIYRR